MEPQFQPETVSKRQSVVGDIAGVDGSVFVGLVALDDVAAVRGDVEPDIGGPRFGAALQHRAQAARAAVVALKRHVVDEEDEGAVGACKLVEKRGQAGELVCGAFDQRQRQAIALQCGNDRFDQGRLAHPARAPQQHIMRGKALRKPLAVGQNIGLLPVNADDQVKRQRRKARNGMQRLAIPMIGWMRCEIGRLGIGWREPFQRIGNAAERVLAQAANSSASSA